MTAIGWVHAANAIPRFPVVHEILAGREGKGSAGSLPRLGALTTRCDGATARREQCLAGNVFDVLRFLRLLLLVEKLSADLAGGVLEHNVGEHRRVGLVRQVRAETDADVEGSVEVQVMGGPNWCIGSPARLTKRAKAVAALFNADALGRWR